jgi:hypothetical protein
MNGPNQYNTKDLINDHIMNRPNQETKLESLDKSIGPNSKIEDEDSLLFGPKPYRNEYKNIVSMDPDSTSFYNLIRDPIQIITSPYFYVPLLITIGLCYIYSLGPEEILGPKNTFIYPSLWIDYIDLTKYNIDDLLIEIEDSPKSDSTLRPLSPDSLQFQYNKYFDLPFDLIDLNEPSPNTTPKASILGLGPNNNKYNDPYDTKY